MLCARCGSASGEEDCGFLYDKNAELTSSAVFRECCTAGSVVFPRDVKMKPCQFSRGFHATILKSRGVIPGILTDFGLLSNLTKNRLLYGHLLSS